MKADHRLEDERVTEHVALPGCPGAASGRRTTLTLAPYLALARNLADLLVPAPPDPGYRQRLHDNLVATARQQQALRLLGIASPAYQAPTQVSLILQRPVRWWENSERRWALSAAAVGSAASLVGVVAYLVRRRRRSGATA